MNKYEKIANKGKVFTFVLYPFFLSIVSTATVLLGGFFWGIITYGFSYTIERYKEIYVNSILYYYILVFAIFFSVMSIFMWHNNYKRNSNK